MRISDWSSDVCSSDLTIERDPSASDGAIEKDRQRFAHAPLVIAVLAILDPDDRKIPEQERLLSAGAACFALLQAAQALGFGANWLTGWPAHDPQAHALDEEHTSELQSLMRISYAFFCLKKKKKSKAQQYN